MKKTLNVIERLGNLDEAGEGIWRSGFWYRPGRNFDLIRIFHERDGLSVRGGPIVRTEPYGDRTIISFRDDVSEHGKAAPKRFGQNGCATTFEAAAITTEEKQRLQAAVLILAERIPEIKKYMAKDSFDVLDWPDGIGGYVNILSRNAINLKVWIDRTQFEGEILLYVAFDSSHYAVFADFVTKYFGSDFETIRGGYVGGDYDWDDASARLYLREPIEEARARRPRWETFAAEQADEYYFGLNQHAEESDDDFLDRVSMSFSGPIDIEWQGRLGRHEMLQKAKDWDRNVRSVEPIGRRRFEIARNPYLVEVALLDSKGQCQNCEKYAPFRTTTNKPYLEVHHIKSLSRGGADTLKNMAAICPNCHRRAHFGKDADVVNEKLCQLATKRST